MRGNDGKDKGYNIKKINEEGWEQLNSMNEIEKVFL